MSEIKLHSFISDDDLYYLERKMFELHIGKRSFGWVPSFEKTKFYSNIKELKEFWVSQEDIIIINEYNEIKTWEQLKEELINWNKNNPKACKPSLDYTYIDKYGYYWHDSEYRSTTHHLR